MRAEDDILEWLIQNRNSGDEEDVIEEVEFKTLEAMVSAVENIAVLFCELIKLISDIIILMRILLDNAKAGNTEAVWKSWRILTMTAMFMGFTL